MSRGNKGFRAGLAVAVVALSGTAATAQVTVNQPIPRVATIRVDAAHSAGAEIPRTIFGTFLEPIGNSTYNGLWAEILENPSLEMGLWDANHIRQMLAADPALGRASDLDLPLPWEPLDYGEGNRYELRYGDAANSWMSLRILGVPGQPTGIRQQVYLPVQRTLAYNGSLYARHVSGPTGLEISLRPRNGSEVLAHAHVDAGATAWTKYTFELTLPEDKLHRLDPADFVVQVTDDEDVDVDEFSLMPNDALDGLDPDAVAMAKALDTPLVRFGGNFTSFYHWQNGIGPRDKRVSMRNQAWGIPEYNTFGTDELLHFCRLIGAQPQVALNLGSGTPDEAAAWVKYIDDHWPQPSGLLWELGNELWGNWNLGYPTLGQLAARTLAFSQAVRKVDPQAKLIATGADPDGFERWNAAQLGNPAGTFDYLSTHFVVTNTDTQMPRASADFVDAASFALPVELGHRLEQQQQQIDAIPSFAHNAHIAFTEWLFIGHRPWTPNFTNMGGAVDTAGFLNMLMSHAGITPISDMTGIMEFAGIWKQRGQVYAAPGYWALRMYSTAHASRPVSVETESGNYSVAHGVGRLPEIAHVPYLDAFAALNDAGDRLTLFCVNRSLTTDIPADVRVDAFPAEGRARVQTLHADTIDESNDENEPDRVVPEKTEEAVNGGTLHHTFPRASVTVITLERSR
ncbi:MAG TPA: alpha-L-arabinofuranosidase C-terminal domain-containing protein [Acidobacteriaceae bacterium]